MSVSESFVFQLKSGNEAKHFLKKIKKYVGKQITIIDVGLSQLSTRNRTIVFISLTSPDLKEDLIPGFVYPIKEDDKNGN